MHAFNLTPGYITIRSGGTNVTQDEDGYLDLSSFQDVFFYLDCKEFAGSPASQIQFETSPTKDDSLFQVLTNCGPTAFTVAVTVFKNILSTNPNVPLARYVRWKYVAASGTTDATFRVYVLANSPGM
jgi:hypothetical protein